MQADNNFLFQWGRLWCIGHQGIMSWQLCHKLSDRERNCVFKNALRSEDASKSNATKKMCVDCKGKGRDYFTASKCRFRGFNPKA